MLAALPFLLGAAAQSTLTSIEPLNPTPLTLSSSPSSSSTRTRPPGGISTELAGESPLESTRIGFPTMLDWWVVGGLNQIEWEWVEPVDGEEVKLNVVLDNLDEKLCPEPVVVNGDETVWAYWSGWGMISELKG